MHKLYGFKSFELDFTLDPSDPIFEISKIGQAVPINAPKLGEAIEA